MATAPQTHAVGSTVSFIAGPTRVRRTGKVTGHDGQFVVVDVALGEGKTKSMKTRPGAITA